MNLVLSVLTSTSVTKILAFAVLENVLMKKENTTVYVLKDICLYQEDVCILITFSNTVEFPYNEHPYNEFLCINKLNLKSKNL